MRIRCDGFSLIEALVALALTASVSAALLPALALASRLHRDGAIETEAAVLAASRLSRLAGDVSAGLVGAGGGIDAASGAPFEVECQVVPAEGAPGAYLLSVRVVPLAARGAAVTLTLVVPDG